jgi:twitching motility protein PilI
MNSGRQMAYSPRELVGLLSDIEQRSQQSARSQSNIELPQHLWQGLVFTLSGVRLTCAMSEISEMLALPDAITRVPGTKDWLVGLANVRGNLLPIVDLQVFLGEKPVVTGKSSRILVLRRGQLLTGLLVPNVIGMRQFDVQNRMDNARIEGAIGAYVYDAFQQGRELWPVFNMRALAADPRFRTAGV